MFRKSIIQRLASYQKSLGYDKKNLWKRQIPNYTHLNRVNAGSKTTSKTDIADTLGEIFLNNRSSRNYSESRQITDKTVHRHSHI